VTVPAPPAHIERVRVPRYLSPSRFVELRQCPLRVFVRANLASAVLPPAPGALFGILLHHVREQLSRGRWGEANTPRDALERTLATATEQMDRILESTPATSRLVPLAGVVGRVRWNTRLFDLRTWAERLRVRPSRVPPYPIKNVEDENVLEERVEDAPRLEVGPEAWVVCPTFRLLGRVDEIMEADDGALELSDFKSGVVSDDEGDVLEHHAVQVRLYALAVEELATGRLVRIYLEGAERLQVPWTPDVRASCAEQLGEMLGRFPAGAVLAAKDLAQPGTWCRSCRLRPGCSAYLETAPTWWMNVGNAPRPLPWDVWGAIETVQMEGGTLTLQIRDSAERAVRVQGLDLRRGIGDLNAGDGIFLFDLKPTEPTIHHGARLQPRNFHELPPDDGLKFERARALQVFRG
jgi:RecB family exonuclease